MEVLNPRLYESIREVFGETHVSSKGRRGSFRTPDAMNTLRKKRTKQYVDVDDWGEVYHPNCPSCGDTKFRLYFSHLCGSYYRNGSGPKLYFSRDIFDCKNEKCRKDLKKWLDMIKWPDINVLDMTGSETIGPKVSSSNLCLAIAAIPPAPLLPLLPENLPGGALDYLVEERKFNPMTLNRDYGCRLVPAGAVWKYPDGYEKNWLEEQLFIPIIQGRRLTSWQTRPLRETHKGEPKYFNMPGSSSAIYNLDSAIRFRDVMVVEGVTDVWRAGSQTIALLGSNLTNTQEFAISTVWGMDGRGVFLVEGDAIDKMKKVCGRLFKTKAFGRGLSMVILEDKDPAKYSTEELDMVFKYALDRTVSDRVVQMKIKECGI